MKKHTRLKCLEDVIEDDVVIFKKGETYKITGFDYKSLVYYAEPEYYDDNLLPDEFAVMPLDRRFEFLSS